MRANVQCQHKYIITDIGCEYNDASSDGSVSVEGEDIGTPLCGLIRSETKGKG